MSEQDREQAFVASGGVESSVSAAHAPEASSAARRHPKWAAILVDDQPGGTDSLFERIVASVFIYGFLALPLALAIWLVVR